MVGDGAAGPPLPDPPGIAEVDRMQRILALRSRVVSAASLALVSMLLLAAQVFADGGSIIYPHIKGL